MKKSIESFIDKFYQIFKEENNSSKILSANRKEESTSNLFYGTSVITSFL